VRFYAWLLAPCWPARALMRLVTALGSHASSQVVSFAGEMFTFATKARTEGIVPFGDVVK